MRLFLLGLLCLLPAVAQPRGFASWPHPLFAVVVKVDDRPDHGNITPYMWVVNVSPGIVEIDENSLSMLDVTGSGMQRSLNQTATYTNLGPGEARMFFPLFWRNQGKRPAALTFRLGDGTKYSLAVQPGMTPEGPFSALPRPLKEAVQQRYKAFDGKTLRDNGTER